MGHLLLCSCLGLNDCKEIAIYNSNIVTKEMEIYSNIDINRKERLLAAGKENETIRK